MKFTNQEQDEINMWSAEYPTVYKMFQVQAKQIEDNKEEIRKLKGIKV